MQNITVQCINRCSFGIFVITEHEMQYETKESWTYADPKTFSCIMQVNIWKNIFFRSCIMQNQKKTVFNISIIYLFYSKTYFFYHVLDKTQKKKLFLTYLLFIFFIQKTYFFYHVFYKTQKKKKLFNISDIYLFYYTLNFFCQ